MTEILNQTDFENHVIATALKKIAKLKTRALATAGEVAKARDTLKETTAIALWRTFGGPTPHRAALQIIEAEIDNIPGDLDEAATAIWNIGTIALDALAEMEKITAETTAVPVAEAA